jgi:hypothetical protein
MSKRATAILMLLMLGAAVAPVSAQEMPEMDEAQLEEMEHYVEMLRSDLRKERVQVIGQAMNFSAEEAAAFWPAYEMYESEVTKLGDSRLEIIGEYAASYWNMTDDKAAELASKALGWEEERMALKKEFIGKISEAISPVIAARFLQVENQLESLIDLQIAQQLPLIQK